MDGMSGEMKMLLAANLRHYRVMLGLSQGEMAERLGIRALAYGKAERGDSVPRDSVLARFCEVARIRLDNLLEPLEVPEVSCLRNKRKTKRQEEESVETIRLAVKRARDIRFLLEEASGRTLESDLARLSAVRQRAAECPEGRAAWARRQFSPCDAFAPERFPGFLDGFGIVVCCFPFKGDVLDGFSFHDEEAGCVIAVDTSETVTWEKRVEAFAHELGHVLCGTADCDHGSKRTGDAAEEEAVRFYRDFLLPLPLFAAQWRSLAVFKPFADRVGCLKAWNKAPASLVLYRVKESGVRGGDVFAEYMSAMRRRGYAEKEEPAPLRVQTAADPYGELAMKALDDGIISLSKCAEFLGERPADILARRRERAFA